jgi:transposase-like protein
MSASARITVEPAAVQPPAHPKRRRYSIVEKRRIVEESFQPKTSVARVAREHGVSANQVFRWRQLYQRGRLDGAVPAAPSAELLPVTITRDADDACAGYNSTTASTLTCEHDPTAITAWPKRACGSSHETRRKRANRTDRV